MNKHSKRKNGGTPINLEKWRSYQKTADKYSKPHYLKKLVHWAQTEAGLAYYKHKLSQSS